MPPRRSWVRSNDSPPGFRDRIAAVRTHAPLDIERENPNNIGGDINGGSVDLGAFIARPRLAVDPYWLGVGGFYLCSSATPPGGGVHGMCGHLAAQAALRRHRANVLDGPYVRSADIKAASKLPSCRAISWCTPAAAPASHDRTNSWTLPYRCKITAPRATNAAGSNMAGYQHARQRQRGRSALTGTAAGLTGIPKRATGVHLAGCRRSDSLEPRSRTASEQGARIHGPSRIIFRAGYRRSVS
jgi:hypothetical protein